METKSLIGLKPKKIHDQNRALEIISAMKRYVFCDIAIPVDWFNELRYLYGEIGEE